MGKLPSKNNLYQALNCSLSSIEGDTFVALATPWIDNFIILWIGRGFAPNPTLANPGWNPRDRI